MRVSALVLLAACGADTPSDALPQCEGGDSPSLSIGEGGLAGFTPWANGTEVPVEQQGDLGIALQLLSTGLDTTAPVSAVIRTTVSGSTGDSIAELSLQCPTEGPGWISLFVSVPPDAQGPDPSYLDGVPAVIHATATDQRGIAASSDDVSVTLVAPTTTSNPPGTP